ncbi:hypothetical protein BGW38_004587, partial [Lunasporangiospora selenospora]
MTYSVKYVVPPNLIEELASDRMPTHDGGLLLERCSIQLNRIPTGHQKEDARLALITLSEFGLVVTKPTSPGSSHFLTNHIARYATKRPFKIRVTKDGDDVEA